LSLTILILAALAIAGPFLFRLWKARRTT
jgi:hypothetical protein